MNNKGVHIKGMLMMVLFLMSVLAVLPFASAGGVQLSYVGDSTKEVDAGDSASFQVSIYNDESSQSYCNFNPSLITGKPVGWNISFSPSSNITSINPSSSKIVTIIVDTTETSTEGQRTIGLVCEWGQSGKNPSGSTSISIFVDIKQNYGVELYSSLLTRSITPPSQTSASFTLRINNTGNGVDTVIFTKTLTPVDWVLQSPGSRSINPFSYTTVQVTASYNGGGLPLSKNYYFEITSTSEDGTHVDSIQFTVYVKPVYDVSLYTSQTVKYIDPTQSIQFDFDVTNEGNAVDTFDVDLSNVPTDWIANPTTDPITNVDPNEDRSFSIIVTAPTTATYNSQAKVYVNVTSVNNITKKYSTSVVAIVNKLHNIEINPLGGNSITIDPGATIITQVQIRNRGNAEDTIRLEVSGEPSHLTVNFNVSQVVIAKDGYKNVNLTIIADEDAPAVQSKITITAYPIDMPTLRITQNITVRVNQDFDVLLQITGANTKHGDPGSSVDFNLSVKNKGNGVDTILMSGSGLPIEWNFYFNPSTVNDLAESEVRIVILTVELPEDATPGSHTLTIKATSDGDDLIFSERVVNVIADPYYDIEISTTTPFDHAVPEGKAYFNVTVRNKGSGNDTFTMSASGLQKNWVKFDISSFQLVPEGEKTVAITATVPKGTLKGDYPITIVATSSGDILITNSVDVTVIVDEKYGVTLWANPATQDVEPGDNIFFTIYVKNTGNVEDEFYVSIKTNPNLWGSLNLTSPFMVLQPNAYKTAKLTVNVPIDAEAQSIDIVVEAISQADTDIKGNCTAEALVDAQYGLQVTGIIVTNEIEPTEKMEYVIKIKNTGNNIDVFNIDLQGANRTWGKLAATTVNLAPDQDIRIFINVTVPDKKDPKDYLIPVKVTSQGNDSKYQIIILTVTVTTKHDVKIVSLNDVRVTIAPGDTYIFDIEVTNLGPDEDTIDFVLSGTHLSWSVLSKYQIVDLGSGSSSTIKLTVHVPSNALPEEYQYTIKATEEAKGRFKWLNLTIEVDQIYDLYLASPLIELEITPGSSDQFTLNVTNTGTGQDTYRFDALDHEDWITFDETMTTVDVNDTYSNTITVSIPQIPLPDEGDYDLEIMVTSLGNENINDSKIFKVTVTQGYDVRVTSNVSVTFVNPGAIAKYTVFVENKGNGQDTFVVSKTGDNPSWVQLNPTTLNLAAGQQASLSVTIQIPTSASQLTMTTTITVTSQGSLGGGGAVMTDDIVLTTNINLVYGVEITPNSKSKTITEDVDYTFPITIRNTGSGTDNFLFEVTGNKKEWVSFNVTKVSTLGPDNTTKVNVTINPPFEKPFDELNGTYQFNIKISSEGFSFKYDLIQVTFKIDVRYGFEATYDKLEQEAGPGEETTFNLTLRNRGNIEDTFLIQPLGAQSSWVRLVNEDYGESYNATVTKSGSKKIKIRVNVPPDAESDNEIYSIEIKVTSKGNDSIDYSKTLKVRVNEEYGVTMELEENNLDGGPSVNASFEIEVKNIGNVAEDIEFEIVNDDNTDADDWTTLSHTAFDALPKSAKRTLYVHLIFPIRVEAGNYNVKVKASVFDGNGDDQGFTTITMTAKVIYAVDADIRTLYREEEADPGDSIEMPWTIENMGTADETFDIFVDHDSMIDKDVKDDWNITLRETGYNKPAIEEILVVKDKVKQMKAFIKVASDAKNKKYTLKIKVISQSDEDTYDSVELFVDVKEFAKINLTTEELKKKVDPGTSKTFTIKVKNEGNAKDTYAIEVDPVGGPYEAKDWWGLTKEELVVDANSYQNVGLTITPDIDAEAGNYTFRMRVESDIDSNEYKVIEVTVEVELRIDFEVTSDDTSEQGEPGETVEFELQIENFGNADDEYEFEWITSPEREKKQFVEVEFDRLLVPYDDKREFSVFVNLSNDVEEAEAGDFTIDLTVTSRNNDSKSDRITLKVKIEAVYNITMTWDGASRPDKLDPNDEDIEFNIKVKNWGNSEDLLTFDVDPPAGWQDSWYNLPSSISIKPLATKEVTLKVRRTSVTEEPARTYSFDFYAISKDGETESNAVEMKFDLIQWDLEFVDRPTIDGSPSVGKTVDIEFNVANNGEADSPANVNIDIYIGNKRVGSGKIDMVAAGSEEAFTISWTPSEAADGQLKLQLRDVEGKKVESTKLSVKVTGDEAGTGIAGAVGLEDNMLYMIIIVIIIVLVVLMAMAGKKKPTLPPAAKPGARPPVKGAKPGIRKVVKKPGEEIGEKKVEGERPKAKVARIKCPKCSEIMDIKSEKRPLEVRCDACNAKLLLKK